MAGRYRVVRKLGEGGMSIVYEARHVKLQRQFAIKRLLNHLVDNQEALERFQREAELLATLRHPNVVEVTDWDAFPDGTPCMVLEYLHGASLDRRLARGPMQWDAIAKIGDQTMSALTLAHRNGITHRDLKPENIFIAIDDLGDERVKLLDFGISKLRGVNKATAVNAMLGTPAYMAPEQASGQSDRVGAWTDVWAMGAILYEMATGRSAFGCPTIADTLMKIMSAQPEPLVSLRNDVPAAFVTLVERALVFDPNARTQTIEELRAAVREALDPRNLYRLNTPVSGLRALTTPGPAPAPGSTPTPTRESQPLQKPPLALQPVQLPAPQGVVIASDGRRWVTITAIVVALLSLAGLAFVLVS